MYNDEEKAMQALASFSATLSVIGSAVSLSSVLGKGKGANLKTKQLRILSSLDLLTSVFFAIGYAGTKSEGFCQFQAFMIYFGSLGSVMWNALISFQLHLWIVKKKNEKRVSKKLIKNAKVTFVFTFILAIILLASGMLGESSTWCWIEEGNDWAKFLFFYLFVLAAWTHNAWIIVKTHSACKDEFKNSTELIIRRKMQEHLTIFVFAWFFGFLNFAVEAIAQEPVMATGILQAFFVPLQGFLNAVNYGGILAEDGPLRTMGSKTATPHSPSTTVTHTLKEKKSRLEPIQHVEYVPREISIFSTTFNLGESPMSTVGDVSEWLRDGHDIYAIGLQECMCLEELRAALHAQLGGEEKFVMFKVEIGSDNTRLGFHGFIALTVFVRKEDVDSGYIRMTESAAGDVANGADLVVTTAANKGAVGIPLRIHDTSIGFVTTHLPSDSKGKSKLPKRNGNAKSMLKDVVLAADDLGVDVQHTMDHIVLMGDLNYRTKTPATLNDEGTMVGEGASALLGIAAASLQDMQAMQFDPLWFRRKYALLHGKKSALYPNAEELEIIKSSEVSSLEAWDSVLRHDELVEMMQIGEVFYGFHEMMPRFPPTYKRKLNEAGECGDYTRYDDLVRGYSHTGEDKEEVSEEVLGRATMDPSSDVNPLERPASLSMLRPESSTSFDIEGGRGRSSSEAERPTSAGARPKPSGKRRSSVFGFGKSQSLDVGEEWKPPTPKKNKRRTSLLNSFKSDAQLDAMAVDKKKSKLRPPSYTDRILVHSLCREKLSYDAYGFCDSIRCSDHRPVSSAMTLTVNRQVIPQVESREEVERVSKVTPHAILLNITIKDLDVSIRRAGEVVNPLAADATPKAVAKPAMESFAEDEEDEEDEEEEEQPLEEASATVSRRLFKDAGAEVSPATVSEGAPAQLRGRTSLLSAEVVVNSGIEAFEVAENVQPAEVVIICPLPTKDPLIEYRKMYDLMNALGGQKGVDIGGLKVSRKRREQLLQHQNSYSWSDAVQGNIELSSCGDVSLGVEALVKLVDSRGEDIGESFVDLGEVIRGERFDQPFQVQVPISCGGQFRGQLQATFTLSRVEEKR